MPSEIKNGCLYVRSVGDHQLEDGFADMLVAMDRAKAEFERSGKKVVMLIDLQESEENRDANEVQQISLFFKQHLAYLDGRIAIFVKKQVHFGLSRMLASLTEESGLDIRPFYEFDKAEAFLGVTLS